MKTNEYKNHTRNDKNIDTIFQGLEINVAQIKNLIGPENMCMTSILENKLTDLLRQDSQEWISINYPDIKNKNISLKDYPGTKYKTDITSIK